MSTISVSNAVQLDAALLIAQGGDTISLAAGNYGDYVIRSQVFTSDVTISSQVSTQVASFHTLTTQASAHIHFDNLAINCTPTAATVSYSSGVKIESSSFISFTHSTLATPA